MREVSAAFEVFRAIWPWEFHLAVRADPYPVASLLIEVHGPRGFLKQTSAMSDRLAGAQVQLPWPLEPGAYRAIVREASTGEVLATAPLRISQQN